MDDRLKAAYRVDAAWTWVLSRDEKPDPEAVRQAAIMCGVALWVVEHLLRFKEERSNTEIL